jgi:hypothetical protein
MIIILSIITKENSTLKIIIIIIIIIHPQWPKLNVLNGLRVAKIVK